VKADFGLNTLKDSALEGSGADRGVAGVGSLAAQFNLPEPRARVIQKWSKERSNTMFPSFSIEGTLRLRCCHNCYSEGFLLSQLEYLVAS
jgi:hypothetical protein